MPVIEPTSFPVPGFLTNRHLNTLWANMMRKVEGVDYRRERIETSDGDFLDLDWSEQGSDRLVIISHGLEGNTTRPYVKGMALTCNQVGMDALAWNFRSCSGELNRKKTFYHGAATWDLEAVIRHALSRKKYSAIFLVGFSLGGNLTLVYLGEKGSQVPPEVQKAAVISVPCWLAESVDNLEKGANRMYEQFFLREYKRKLRAKALIMPDEFDLSGLATILTLREFDNRFVAPVHGFRDGPHLYHETSASHYLHDIRIPTLILNSKDDPFLGPGAYPLDAARANRHLFLEMPETGGHVGFLGKEGYYSEQRVAGWFAPEWFDYPRSMGVS